MMRDIFVADEWMHGTSALLAYCTKQLYCVEMRWQNFINLGYFKGSIIRRIKCTECFSTMVSFVCLEVLSLSIFTLFASGAKTIEPHTFTSCSFYNLATLRKLND